MQNNTETKVEAIHTRIWFEEPEPDNPFATKTAYCHGYDVYGEMLGNARWVDMLYLLFKGEAPTQQQAQLLEALAIALANPGPRDQSVHAAMCGGVGGSTSASCLMAALAVGAGQLSGGREIFLAMRSWDSCGCELQAWKKELQPKREEVADIWPRPEHPSGFDPNGANTASLVKKTLFFLSKNSPGPRLPWLQKNREMLEKITSMPVSLTGVAAAAFADLGFSAEEGEMLFLFLRLPGAAAHALEQRHYGFRKFPFYQVELENDPEGVSNERP